MIRLPRLSRRRALGLAAMLAMPAVARAAMPPITDAIGRTVRLRAPAERIVLAFNFEEFTAIGGPAGWDRVVGYPKSWWADNRTAAFPRYAAAIPRLNALPDVGNMETSSFSLEKVLSLRPDLVIFPDVWMPTYKDQMAQLEQLGIPVLVIDYNAQIPQRHIASVLAVGAAIGADARARELATLYETRLADIQGRAARATRRPKVYIELGQGGADVIGNTYWKGMWGRMLDLIGADNIAANRIAGAWGPLSPEYVLAANPDVVFIAGSSWVNRPNAVLTGFDADPATTRARLAPYANRKGWGELTAIRAGELHAIEHGLCRSLFDYTALYYVAKQLYPEAFADIDPVAELRAYHDRFLPVRFQGTWMARLT